MGFVYILLALLCGITKGYCGKKTSGMIPDFHSAVRFNTVRMLLCIPIGLVFVLFQTGGISSLRTDRLTLTVSALGGLATAVFVVTWLLAVRTGAYMMVDVFPTMGVILPVFLCRVFFGESIRWNHIAGILVLTAAAYVLCTYNRAIGKPRLTPSSLAVLTVCGVSYGLSSFSQKWFRYECGMDVSVYNFYVYLSAALLLLLCLLSGSRKENTGARSENDASVRRKLLFYVTLMSVCIFLHSVFSTFAAGYLPASQLYPLMQGGALILSMVMSAVCFGEKITPRCVLGIALAFGALILTNCL